MNKRSEYGDTWIDPEEYAYPTGSLRQSRRRFAARCPDYKIRRGVCGIADTFSTVPARLKANGKTVAGFVAFDTEREELTFTPYKYHVNRDAFPSAPMAEHSGPVPHGVGCRECRAARVCNECGRAWSPVHAHCTHGRCTSCCNRVCNHREY